MRVRRNDSEKEKNLTAATSAAVSSANLALVEEQKAKKRRDVLLVAIKALEEECAVKADELGALTSSVIKKREEFAGICENINSTQVAFEKIELGRETTIKNLEEEEIILNSLIESKKARVVKLENNAKEVIVRNLAEVDDLDRQATVAKAAQTNARTEEREAKARLAEAEKELGEIDGRKAVKSKELSALTKAIPSAQADLICEVNKLDLVKEEIASAKKEKQSLLAEITKLKAEFGRHSSELESKKKAALSMHKRISGLEARERRIEELYREAGIPLS